MSNAAVTTAKRLIEWKMASANMNWLPARDHVAADAGLAPGSLRRLFSGTLRDITKVGRALDELFLKVGERQISALKHEMALARARGESDRPIDMAGFEAAMAAARRALGRESSQ